MTAYAGTLGEETRRRQQSLWLLHLGVLILGGTGLFSRAIDLNALDMTGWRSLIAALTLLVWLGARRASLRLGSLRAYLLVGVLGALMAGHWVTYFHSMQLSSVAVGMVAIFTYPVITVLLEPLFSGERPEWRDIASGLLVLCGIALMAPAFTLDHQVTAGIAWGVFSALLFALRNILQRHYLAGLSSLPVMLFQTVVVAVLVLPFSSDAIVGLGSGDLVLLLMLGTLFTALPHTLFANSLRYLKAKTVSLIACLQPLYGTVLAALLLAERPDWQTLVGGLLVTLAAVYESLRK